MAEDWPPILSCADKAVRDGSFEVVGLFTMGVLKKRELWCSFTTRGVTSVQNVLLYSPLDKQCLCPQSVVKESVTDLQKKSTQDLLAQSSKCPKELSAFSAKSVSPLQQHSFCGGSQVFLRPSSKMCFSAKSIKRTSAKTSSKK